MVFSHQRRKNAIKSRLNVKQMQQPTAFQGPNQNVTCMWMLLKDKTRAHKTTHSMSSEQKGDD